MKRTVMRVLVLAACVITFAATAAASAKAADGPGDDPQLEDVSKQVSSIEKKLDELLAHGRWAKAGARKRGLWVRRPVISIRGLGDDASYVLAPQGDLSATDGWTLDKQATVVPWPTP